jgi:hypothetical protein
MQNQVLLNNKARWYPLANDSAPTWDVDLATLLEEACGLNGLVQSGVGDLPGNGFRYLRSAAATGGIVGLGAAESIHWYNPITAGDTSLVQGSVPKPPNAYNIVNGVVGASAQTFTSATPTGTNITLGLDASVDPLGSWTSGANAHWTCIIPGYYSFTARVYWTIAGNLATPAATNNMVVAWNQLTPTGVFLASGTSQPTFNQATLGSPYGGLLVTAAASFIAGATVALQVIFGSALVGTGSLTQSTITTFSIEGA